MKREQRAKIRIGYFSGDFCIHPVSALMVGVIETHDRSRFESIAFSYGPDVQDDMRRRMERAFDRFLDVSDVSDQDIATMARCLELDIAVDLTGYTGNGRTKIFALRAAPIQVGYIGYLGTMAASYIDYIVADPMLIPVAEQHYYSEKIIYLPSYQANDSKRRGSDTHYSRDRLGLPRDAFVFACLNSNYKITPMTFSVWMRILTRVRGSVLYLYASNQMAERNLRLEAERRGIDPQRIVFGERLTFEEYLARYRAMDLFLDTLPYNAGTTASDALWAGLPVLTCAGRAFAGRVAASLLTAINLPELITYTLSVYEDLAVKLAMNPNVMGEIREKLAIYSQTASLFDTARFTRNLEEAYVEVVQRYDAGLDPKHIYVADAADVAVGGPPREHSLRPK
jgi:predicted O-linked N-acetylglucosamine transferase (SPINDLY family)